MIEYGDGGVSSPNNQRVAETSRVPSGVLGGTQAESNIFGIILDVIDRLCHCVARDVRL